MEDEVTTNDIIVSRSVKASNNYERDGAYCEMLEINNSL